MFYIISTAIENPEKFKDEHLAYCKSQNLLGRILVSSEGINGTLSGTFEQTENYMNYLKSLQGFQDTFFKIDEVDAHAFSKNACKS